VKNASKIKIALVWPPQQIMVETMFRHYVDLAETAGYLIDSKIFKELNYELEVHDCTTSIYSASDLAQIAYRNDFIGIVINPYNVLEAVKISNFFKSIKKKLIILAYGSFCCYKYDYICSLTSFDYVISSGQWELGIEIALFLSFGIENKYLNTILQMQNNFFSLKGKNIIIRNKISLPPEEWGIPALQYIPIEDYLKIGKGIIQIRVCRGCQYGCTFCDEAYVAGELVRYRPIEKVVNYITNYPKGANKAYLNASMFTANRKWVINFCDVLASVDHHLPWRTCTRLDMIDQELIVKMANADCKRISFGIESLEKDVQDKVRKPITKERIKLVSNWCHDVGITPRALLILGFNGQTAEGLKKTDDFLQDIGMEIRYRPFLNLNHFIEKKEIEEFDLNKIDRWSIVPKVENMEVSEIRRLEFNLR
jgi:anaerobic magnesium-protoporphyrin IX monomethyl ester cyclase